MNEEVQPEYTDYAMTEITSHLHEHDFVMKQTDAQGWQLWQCSCGMGYGKAPKDE
jgi:hypothetical protein